MPTHITALQELADLDAAVTRAEIAGDVATLDAPVTRAHGDSAIRIGRHVQEAEFQGRPVNGEFRAPHIAVRDGGRWRLAGVHLSPIGGPPPFARPDDAQENRP